MHTSMYTGCMCVCWGSSMELNNYYTIVWIRLWWMCACLWSFPLKSNLIFHRPNFGKVAKKLYCIVYRCTIQNLDHFSNLFGNLKCDTHAMASNIFRHWDRNASVLYVWVCVCTLSHPKTKFKYKHSFIFGHWMCYFQSPW